MNRNHKWILAAIPLMGLLATQGSYAQSAFYKWVDEKGATHYTQTPPPQKVVKKIVITTLAPADSEKEIKNLNSQLDKNLKAVAADEKTAEESKAKAAADAARRNKNSKACEQLKNSQATLQSGQRLRTSDAKGERSYMTEEQKTALMNQQAAQIQKDCP